MRLSLGVPPLFLLRLLVFANERRPVLPWGDGMPDVRLLASGLLALSASNGHSLVVSPVVVCLVHSADVKHHIAKLVRPEANECPKSQVEIFRQTVLTPTQDSQCDAAERTR